ncbi:MAG: 2-phopspho-L-lactate transferase [Actinomycetota bacterium]|jgi:LPPG:FO 2-phospho-L-lactate transferase
MIVVLAGGVGAARFLAGLVQVVPPSEIVTIVNTGDDTELHGLAISPDIDTVTYTLADAIDPARGWGLRDETWRAMESLERFEKVRPSDSTAAPRWFNLGDQDLATHFYRTARLREGATLEEVTDEIRRAFNVGVKILPMTNDSVRTVVHLEHGSVSFQEYFVKLQHNVAVTGVEFVGATDATCVGLSVLDEADCIVIAPSNPIVSLGPIRALPHVNNTLARLRDKVVAVSPIVAGAALKGPADRMLVELGHEPTAVGVAAMYSDICSTMVIDEQDADLAEKIRNMNMSCVVTDTIMSRPGVAKTLAHTVVQAVLTKEKI